MPFEGSVATTGRHAQQALKKRGRMTGLGTRFDRRAILIAAGGLLVSARGLAVPAAAALSGERSRLFEEVFQKLTAGRTPESEGSAFRLEMPELAENGNMVLFKLNVDSPMTQADHVTAIHMLSTQNPQAHVATFRLSPASGKAAVNGRMRLAKTQDVVALADLSDGRMLMAARTVQVTIGGCGL